jgi:hypothetical protein
VTPFAPQVVASVGSLYGRTRRGVAQELQLGEDADVTLVAKRLGRKHFVKTPDVALGQVVEEKLNTRARVQAEPVVDDGVRVRRSLRRAGKRR